MQIEPSWPSGTGCPVSTSTICTMNASSKMCSPSCAGHSTATHCTSWEPYEVKHLVEAPRAVVRAVEPRVEDGVTGTDALHVEGARREDGAGVAVPLRVEGRARLPGRAARHVDAHRLLQRHVRGDALVVAPRR